MTTHASFHHPADDPAVAQAAVARDGVLLSADPVLVALNTRAGGMIGAPLAVPQLAAITKLSQRLGIIVSRGTVIADDDVDIDLWVRAQPDGDHIRLRDFLAKIRLIRRGEHLRRKRNGALDRDFLQVEERFGVCGGFGPFDLRHPDARSLGPLELLAPRVDVLFGLIGIDALLRLCGQGARA